MLDCAAAMTWCLNLDRLARLCVVRCFARLPIVRVDRTSCCKLFITVVMFEMFTIQLISQSKNDSRSVWNVLVRFTFCTFLACRKPPARKVMLSLSNMCCWIFPNRYFGYYDKSRSSLSDAYHENAVFSLNVPTQRRGPSLGKYLEFNRNLNNSKHKKVASELFYIYKLDARFSLKWLPLRIYVAFWNFPFSLPLRLPYTASSLFIALPNAVW